MTYPVFIYSSQNNVASAGYSKTYYGNIDALPVHFLSLWKKTLLRAPTLHREMLIM